MKLAKQILEMVNESSNEEIWKITKSEYEKKFGKPKKNTTVTGGFSAHKSAVETALNQGEKVPKEVLKDYPDLNESKDFKKLDLIIDIFQEQNYTQTEIDNLYKMAKGEGKFDYKSAKKILEKITQVSKIYIDSFGLNDVVDAIDRMNKSDSDYHSKESDKGMNDLAEKIADYLSNGFEHDDEDDAVKHLSKEFGLEEGAKELIKGWLAFGPKKQLHMTLKEQVKWILSIIK